MDLIIYIISVLLLILLIASHDNLRLVDRRKAKIAMIICLVMPVTACVVSIKTATTTKEIFYDVDSYGGINFDQPADLLVTSTIYPKWSVLTNNTFFTQIPKGK